MSIEIGRLHSFAVGTESTPGTAGAIKAWIPLENGSLKPVVEMAKDESGFANITGLADAHVTKTGSEFAAKGIIRPTSIGYLLLAALGQSAAPTTVETGVYKHAFTLLNTNAHPSLTIIHDDTTQEDQSTYHMVDTLDIIGEIGQYAKFDLKTKGRKLSNATGNTPSFTTENPFLVSKASVKFAADIAGLGAASKVPVQNFKFTLEKNLEQIYGTMSNGTEALDFASQHNTVFGVKGEFEIVYGNTTYKDLFTAGTKQAIEISLEGRSLIGATKYETLTFQFASVVLEDWELGDDRDAIGSQSFGFTALYKLGETKMLTADLTNTKSTQYA